VPGGQRIIFVAGQLGFLPDGKMAGDPGDFKAQAHQAFKNVDAALIAAGAEWKHVVKINMYVTDAESQIPLLRQVRDSFVNTSAPPTSTTVEISRLVVEGALFEIDAVAVLP
jgi:enamine deaminase RidA (YjgF/YER057c/UK114 family)